MTVNQISGYCTDCRDIRAFAQVHPDPGSCFDGSGAICPEWYCMACGAAVLLSILPAAGQSLAAAELTRRARVTVHGDDVRSPYEAGQRTSGSGRHSSASDAA